MNCTCCGEPVADPKAQRHRECELRMVIGSVAHLEGRCNCFVEGSTENDPPGMTLREAALNAVTLWLYMKTIHPVPCTYGSRKRRRTV